MARASAGARSPINTTATIVRTFLYTGNGAALRDIDLGFKPDIVIIKGNAVGSYGIFKTPVTWANATPYVSNAAPDNFTGGVFAITAQGFTVNSSAIVNSSGVAYHGIAIKGTSATVAYGNYAGDGVSGRKISTPFRPAFVMVKRDNNYAARWRDDLCASGSSHAAGAAANVTDGILDFADDGFTVGNSQGINNATGALGYQWFAIAAIPEMEQLSYVGDGLDNRDITGLSFDPSFVMVKTSGQFEKFITNKMVAGVSADFNNQTFTTNRLQALTARGFQVGTETTVNASGSTFHAICFQNTDSRSQAPLAGYNHTLSFTGGSDKVTATASPAANLDQISVMVHVNPRSITGGRMLSIGSSAAARLWFQLGGTNAMSVNAGFSTTNGSWATLSNFIKLGVWQHLGFSYDQSSSANSPTLYVNGMFAEASTSSSPVGSAVVDDGAIYLGNNSLGNVGLNGLMGEVVILSRIATIDEFRQHYLYGTVPTDSVVARYKLDEGSGLTAVDSSTFANNGSVSGGTYSAISPLKARQVSTMRVAA